MKERSRRAYRNLALLFLAIGAGFLVAAAVQAATGARLLNGDPVPVALLVLVLGAVLLWTVARAPRIEEPTDGAPGDASAPVDASGASDEGAGANGRRPSPGGQGGAGAADGAEDDR